MPWWHFTFGTNFETPAGVSGRQYHFSPASVFGVSVRHLGVTTKQWNLIVTQIGQAAQLQNLSLYLTLCFHLLPRAGASCKMRKRESSLRGRYVSPTLTDKTPLVKTKLFYGQQTST